MIGRVGPAFDTKRKYRLVSNKSFLFAHIPAVCVWDVEQNSYVTLSSGKVPLIPGEFVDVVRAEFDWAGKPEVRIFVARQMDDLIGILTVVGYEQLLDKNNPTNIWIEEI